MIIQNIRLNWLNFYYFPHDSKSFYSSFSHPPSPCIMKFNLAITCLLFGCACAEIEVYDAQKEKKKQIEQLEQQENQQRKKQRKKAQKTEIG